MLKATWARITVQMLSRNWMAPKKVTRAAPSTISGMMMGRNKAAWVTPLPRKLDRPRASAARVPMVVESTVVAPATSRLFFTERSSSLFSSSFSYQRKEKPSQLEAWRPALKESTIRMTMGAYRKK